MPRTISFNTFGFRLRVMITYTFSYKDSNRQPLDIYVKPSTIMIMYTKIYNIDTHNNYYKISSFASSLRDKDSFLSYDVLQDG